MADGAHPRVAWNRHKVAEQNNLGVACFEANDFQKAVSMFRDALEWSTTLIDDSNVVSAPELANLPRPLNVVNPFAPILKARLPHEDDSTDAQSLLCFIQALEIVASPTAYSDNPVVNDVLVSAMVIWNMAVVYHYTSHDFLDGLVTAYALYIKSWGLVENIVCDGSSGNYVIDFFTQALLNNLGCCCQELGRDCDARMWADELISYAQTIGSLSSEEYPNALARLQEQTNHFVLNAIVRLQCRPSCLASAACSQITFEPAHTRKDINAPQQSFRFTPQRTSHFSWSTHNGKWIPTSPHISHLDPPRT